MSLCVSSFRASCTRAQFTAYANACWFAKAVLLLNGSWKLRVIFSSLPTSYFEMMRLTRSVERDALLCFVKPVKLFRSSTSLPSSIIFPCGQLLLPLLALSSHVCVQKAKPSMKRKRGGRLHSRGLLPYNHSRRMFRKIRLCKAHIC